MNRYIITCINDFGTYSGYAAYAESLFDEDMNNAADAYAFEIAVGIVPDSFIVTTEGYEYHNMTEEAIRQVVDSIEWKITTTIKLLLMKEQMKNLINSY